MCFFKKISKLRKNLDQYALSSTKDMKEIILALKTKAYWCNIVFCLLY